MLSRDQSRALLDTDRSHRVHGSFLGISGREIQVHITWMAAILNFWDKDKDKLDGVCLHPRTYKIASLPTFLSELTPYLNLLTVS